jgi:hypothetical protein
MSSCLLSGLPDDPLVDAEIWRYDLVLGTPASGSTPAQPFDLTGSDLAIVMRVRGNWQIVSALATDPNWQPPDGALLDGTITITNPTGGEVSIVSDPWKRLYRVPHFALSTGPMPVSVQADLLRLLKNNSTARPELLGSILFPLRASTTQWPAPAS